MVPHTISFIGAGRVASALCHAIYAAGYKIELIISETESNGLALADSCKANWSRDLIFPDTTDLIIVAVPDQRLKGVLEKLNCYHKTLVVHTAGSTGINIFPENIKRKGVFYPLQTFSKGRNVDFNDLPFLIESSDIESTQTLQDLAKSLGGKIHYIDSEHRRMLHLAAVFACNFTNHMLTAGKDITSQAGFPFDILGPLIKETIAKALDIGPEKSQTGPAIRNDQTTIGKHLELLSFSPELQKMYGELTQEIIRYYKDKRQE